MESLDRGLVAVPVEDGVLVRWRLLGTEPIDLGFHVFRNGERVNNKPITESTNFLDPDGTTESTYAVRPVGFGRIGERDHDEWEWSDWERDRHDREYDEWEWRDGEMGRHRREYDGNDDDRKPGMSKSVEVWDNQYKEIPLNKPDPVESEDGETITYHANDASVGDLTGNGTLDIVQKWTPSDAGDNLPGHRSDVLLDGYTMEGEHLWRINLGQNIRAGPHYTPFAVYDFDGDGTAELAVRTSDGTTDGTGTVIGDPDADYTNEDGFVLEGPEYLTVFDGETGEALATEDFEPARGDVCDWGDCYGNRVDRFLAGAAYLDGERPSILMTRGYYEKTMLAAWDFRDDELEIRWIFDSTDGNQEYEGQGNHQLTTADVDGDGKDEIVYGACVIDHDGTGLYSTGWNHGDALHVGDFDPGRDGLEVFQPHESGPYGMTFRDAGTGELLWGVEGEGDIGRGLIADIDPNYDGAEAWAGIPLSDGGLGTWSASGERISENSVNSINFGIWWTGDLHRELLDHDFLGYDEGGYGHGWIKKWNSETEELELLRSFDGTRSNNGSKGTPCLSGDILGDWREEVIWRTDDSETLRLYATPYETDHRLHTLLHDSQYRTALAWQNAGYNQPPWPSYFLGHGMDDPPKPDIELVSSDTG
ncbi:rhamnogalacturonan lyase [Natrinema sp. 74]|uniref:rhamnogalacturonan lyase n=1 Tax=Natrinema sp. 74 TaxID=3384159 RepID=UPI0038D453B4